MESMFGAPTDQFDAKFRGTFGRFKTKSSHPAFYFMTTVPINRLKNTLQVAADALPIHKIKFSQMIQRDVNVTHVSDIKNYIVASQGRSVFFAPLLVSIINKDASGEIIEYFKDRPKQVESDDGNSTTITWDSNLFRLKLWGSKAENEKMSLFSELDYPFYYHDFGAHLDLNPGRSSLVVIDGQHRYKALSSLYESDNYQSVVAGIEVPICVVFSPFAVGATKSGLDDLRDLFITVNNEAKRVSGHFLQLLDDRRFSSEAVRAFAELWKVDSSHGYSKLHHLEWNIHDEKKAGQLNRPYSITSVSIIFEALSTSLFVARVASTVLQLSAVQEKLIALDEEFDIDAVADDVSQSPTDEVIYAQIAEHVAKPLSILFTEFSPYSALIAKMEERIKRLAIERNKGDRPEFDVLQKMIERHQIPSEVSAIGAPETQLAFSGLFKDVDANQQKVTRLAVFQQALIRAWVALSRELIKYGVLPNEAAYMVVAAFEKTLVPNDMQFLGSSTFTQRVLWQGEKANFKGVDIKRGWLELMLSTVSMKVAVDAAIHSLEKSRGGKITPQLRQNLTTSLRNIARSNVSGYLSTLKDQLIKFYKNNYMEVIQDEEEIDHLSALKKSSDPDEKQKFDEAIREIAAERFAEGKDKLLAYVSVELDALID